MINQRSNYSDGSEYKQGAIEVHRVIITVVIIVVVANDLDQASHHRELFPSSDHSILESIDHNCSTV